MGYDPNSADAVLPPIRHLRGGKKGRFLLEMDPGDEPVDDLSGTWFEANWPSVLRYQGIDVLILCIFGLAGIVSVMIYWLTEGCASSKQIRLSRKLLKNFAAVK